MRDRGFELASSPFVPSEVEGRWHGGVSTRLDTNGSLVSDAMTMLDIALDADPEWDSSDWNGLARSAATAAIAESAFPQLGSGPRNVELGVRLTGDEEVRALNSQWRGKDKPTNVLSFPLAEADEFDSAIADGPELMLGDIVLARGVCAAEAADKGIGIEAHASHLMIHGTLHLLGYDHHDDAAAEDMEAREVRALARLGIADPYGDRG